MNILEAFEYNQHFVAMMNIINKSKLFPPITGQVHHIIPRCWFKHNNLKVDNTANNTVKLSKNNCRYYKDKKFETEHKDNISYSLTKYWEQAKINYNKYKEE